MKRRYRVCTPHYPRKILAIYVVWEGKMTDSRKNLSLGRWWFSLTGSLWHCCCCWWQSLSVEVKLLVFRELQLLQHVVVLFQNVPGYTPHGNPPLLCTCLQSRPQIIVFVLKVVAVSEWVFKCTSTKPAEQIELILKKCCITDSNQTSWQHRKSTHVEICDKEVGFIQLPKLPQELLHFSAVWTCKRSP